MILITSLCFFGDIDLVIFCLDKLRYNMMSFQLWLELSDITGDSLAGMQLKVVKDMFGNKYVNEFEIGGIGYKVKLTPRLLNTKIGELKGFELMLLGPDEKLVPTGMAGASASRVYLEMMKTLKKVESMKPDEMEFFLAVPAVERTRSIYDRLFRRFMPNFENIGNANYVRTDILEKIRKIR